VVDQPVAPGRGEQQEVAAFWREPPVGATEAVEPGESGEHGLALAVPVGRAVSDDGLVLRGRAGDEQVDVGGVEPARDVVLHHAVLEEGEAPPGGRQRRDGLRSRDGAVGVGGDELAAVEHQQLPAQ
jgi:hypothetical protein